MYELLQHLLQTCSLNFAKQFLQPKTDNNFGFNSCPFYHISTYQFLILPFLFCYNSKSMTLGFGIYKPFGPVHMRTLLARIHIHWPESKLTKSHINWIWICILVFNATFSYITATSFSGGGSWSTRREPPTLGKQLVNFITCSCESSAPFFVIYKAGCEPTPYWW